MKKPATAVTTCKNADLGRRSKPRQSAHSDVWAMEDGFTLTLLAESFCRDAGAGRGLRTGAPRLLPRFQPPPRRVGRAPPSPPTLPAGRPPLGHPTGIPGARAADGGLGPGCQRRDGAGSSTALRFVLAERFGAGEPLPDTVELELLLRRQGGALCLAADLRPNRSTTTRSSRCLASRLASRAAQPWVSRAAGARGLATRDGQSRRSRSAGRGRPGRPRTAAAPRQGR